MVSFKFYRLFNIKMAYVRPCTLQAVLSPCPCGFDEAGSEWSVRRDPLPCRSQRLINVGKDIVDVLQANRQAHEILGYAGLRQFFC